MSNKIVIGDRAYDKITSGSVHLAASLLSDSLEANTFDFELESEDDSILFVPQNAPVSLYQNETRIGLFYKRSASRVSQSIFHIAAASTMIFLIQAQHFGGIYTGETVDTVVRDICGKIPVHIKSNLKNIKLYGHLPKASARDNLSQVMFAIGAAVKTDLEGYLRIEGLWDGVSEQIGKNRVAISGTVSEDTPVTHVSITEHQYTKGTERETIFEGEAVSGNIINFDSPMHDLLSEGFSIMRSGANFAELSGGKGVLTGIPYTHITRELTRKISNAQTDNPISPSKNATLVSASNAVAVLDRLENFYQHVSKITQDIVYHAQLPGDVVNMTHPYGTMAQGCIESVDISISNLLRGRVQQLVGFTPLAVGEAQYYDYVEVITENTIWVKPAYAKNFRSVMISAADGGTAGGNGEHGGGKNSNEPSSTRGGAGGTAGAAGMAGKVLVMDFEVPESASFVVKIGTGGKGGIVNADNSFIPPGSGGATVFGTHTSANGAVNPQGYYDPLHGVTYATAGINGKSGANGGNASEEKGEDGESAGSFSGGIGGDYTIKKIDPTTYYRAGGGGGGGAGYSGNGGNGTAGVFGGINWAYCGNGGTGGGSQNSTPAKQIIAGVGGSGGNGGGGGGAGGDYTYPGYRGLGGEGGRGGNGGDGANGCVLIYYHVPIEIASGEMLDKLGRRMIDKHGRRIVV